MALKLRCGNDKVYKSVPASYSNSRYCQEIKQRGKINNVYCFDAVCENIFTMTRGDKKMANTMTAYLVLGDEWSRPINQSDASILFFAICNNVDTERNIMITNFSQAKQLWTETENDYTQLLSPDVSEDVAYEYGSVTGIKFMMEGTKVSFKVPCGTFQVPKMKKGFKTYATSKGQPILVCDNDDEIAIPWKLYSEIVKKRKDGKKLACVGISNNLVTGTVLIEKQKQMVEILNYCGFRIDNEIDFEEMYKNHRLVFQDNKIMCVGETMDDEDWKRGIFRVNKNYFIIYYNGERVIYQNN